MCCKDNCGAVWEDSWSSACVERISGQLRMYWRISYWTENYRISYMIQKKTIEVRWPKIDAIKAIFFSDRIVALNVMLPWWNYVVFVIFLLEVLWTVMTYRCLLTRIQIITQATWYDYNSWVHYFNWLPFESFWFSVADHDVISCTKYIKWRRNVEVISVPLFMRYIYKNTENISD
jgi:hypothetical protein